LKRASFRFLFAYILLYASPLFAFFRLPGFGWLEDLWNRAWSCVVPWVSARVFGVTRGFPDTSDGFIDVRYS
jgi:hypothetical protein